jgi:hypothetical protein
MLNQFIERNLRRLASTWEHYRGTTVVLPWQYRGNTVAIPWRHRAGVGAEPGGQPEGRPSLTRLELHPAGLLPLPEPSAHGALAPEFESPLSQQPKMSTSLAPRGLHELALHLPRKQTSNTILSRLHPACIPPVTRSHYPVMTGRDRLPAKHRNPRTHRPAQ